MSTLSPLWDKLLVKREAADESYSENIATADAYKKRKSRGTVIAAGAGRLTVSGAVVPLIVKVGAKVLFGEHAGVDLPDEGQDLVMLREDELLGFYQD